MKRSVLLFTCVLFLICSSLFSGGGFATAQVNEGELQQFLVHINWTTDELVDYLEFYNVSLQDFDSLAELEDFLGTPITTENLNDLLGRYNIDYNDLETLLAEYGETPGEYQFIEDLQLDVEFYLSSQKEFSVVNDFLSLFGLTEDEIQQLFDHVSRLEDDTVKQKLGDITSTLEELSYFRGVEQLSPEEEEQLFSVWNDLLEALQLESTFFLVKDAEKTKVELIDLVDQASSNGFSLQITMQNYSGEVLATLIFSEEMLGSHLMYESLEQVTEVATLAEEYRSMLQVAKLPVTAGHYVSNILVSLFLILSGFAMLIVVKRRVNF